MASARGRDVCAVPGCSKCKSDDYTQCEKCASGYRLTSTYTCEACAEPNCDCCDGSVTKCEACKDSYYLTAVSQLGQLQVLQRHQQPSVPQCVSGYGPGGCQRAVDNCENVRCLPNSVLQGLWTADVHRVSNFWAHKQCVSGRVLN
ncbi:uncharacterized protein LOC126766700 [Bactrocera neohumeralis]|uniref:uncharacterized protein LOC126766700 n=1 Tax=Bactrocera neohumeralis TaxID=98809 RepID=UPI0021656670|nr:uncharacterized protein LOC126766700 [Bactrocera neohumeralis]